MKKYTAELQFATQLAKDAGVIMLQYFGQPPAHHKADGSVVTIADQVINDLLIARSAQKFPTYAILAEEKNAPQASPTYTWVCDPIDGSLPFSLGIPTCVFALALVNAAGKPVVAVVYDPFLDSMYWAVEGNGAYQNGIMINIPAHNTTQQLIGFSGRSSKVLEVPAFVAAIDATHQRVATKSFIYESMLVATGRLSSAVLMGDGAHDAAAAQLIVQEAGGQATSLFGVDQRYDRPIQGLIVATPLVHAQLVAYAKTAKNRTNP